MKIIAAKTLSAREIELITRLEYEDKEIYTREQIIEFTGNKVRAQYLIKKLCEKKRLKTIIKGTYLFIPMKAPQGQWKANEYLMAKALARKADFYIGLGSVFNSYGFIDQVPQVIDIINNKYSQQKVISGVKYKLKKVLPDRLYGLETRKIKNEEVFFPDRERALIDVFDFYDVKKAFSILKEQLGNIDITKFIKYLSLYPVQQIRRRAGFLLEKLAIKDKMLDTINTGEKGYSKLLDNDINKGRLNKKWRIIINGSL
jgi:predicted transcriptional regulator of viral defense system